MKLYIFTSDCGDGSRGIHYCLSKAWVDKQKARADNDELDYDDIGMDGDGFGYDTINVPDGSTKESLGIHYLIEDDEDEEEDA